MISFLAEKVKANRSDFLNGALGQLEKKEVEAAFAGFRTRKRVYTAWALVQVFLAQVMQGLSCRAVVEWAIQHKLIGKTASTNTGAYCNARKALPEGHLLKLALGVGRRAEENDPECERFFDRPVRVADGSGLRLPDAPENQKEYPQHGRQKPGCGFPTAYVVVLMSLAVGTILDLVIGPGPGNERSLFRVLWRSLNPNDIVLGDAGLGSYADIAMLQKRGVDVVFRLGNRRTARRVVKLGPGDWLETWDRPKVPYGWVALEDLPEKLTVRVIEYRCPIKGFRSRLIRLATTLLFEELYPRKELLKLYWRRWELELRFRDIKSTMNLEPLVCKTPEGCRKELWMGILAYNLIRTVMVDAARRGRVLLSRISYAGTLHRLIEFANGWLVLDDPESAYALLLDHLITDPVPHRPNRVEPRKVKFRGQAFPWLTRDRHTERAALLEA